MFFALVALPAGAGLIKAAAKAKKAYKSRKAWKKEARGLQKEHGDLSQRRLCTLNVMLTQKEAELFDDSPAGEFLAERTISDESAALLQGRAS